LELTAYSALFHASITLKICPLIALGASGTSIRAFQTVRITSSAHVFLSKIVAGAFGDTLVVQEQTKLRLTVTCQTLTGPIASKTGVVTVGSDSEATLRIQHLVSFVGEHLHLETLSSRGLFTCNQTV
jgi:hypothetical protein